LAEKYAKNLTKVNKMKKGMSRGITIEITRFRRLNKKTTTRQLKNWTE